MSFAPQTSQAILHHVPHNPVRREQLSRRRNPFLCNLHILFQKGKGLVFRLNVIVLIQPADDLHLALFFYIKIVFSDIMNQMIDYAVLIRKGDIEQQLGIVVGLLKQFRQNLMELIALPDKQHAEQLVQPALLFQPQDQILFRSSKVQICIERICYKIRLILCRILRGEHAHPGRQIVVDFHEPDCNKPVKPGIRDFLYDSFEGVRILAVSLPLFDGFDQGVSLVNFPARYLDILSGTDIKELQILC